MTKLVFVGVSAMVLGCGEAPDAADAPWLAPGATAVVAAEPVPAAELCFRVDPAVLAAFPAAEDRLVGAGAAWGWPVRVGGDCANRLGVEQMAANANGTTPAAKHRPSVWTGTEWLRMSDGGASEIVLSTVALAGIADEPEADCSARWAAGGEPRRLLSRVLTHELGHALGLGESDTQTDAMFWFAGSCKFIAPTAAEIEATRRILAP